MLEDGPTVRSSAVFTVSLGPPPEYTMFPSGKSAAAGSTRPNAKLPTGLPMPDEKSSIQAVAWHTGIPSDMQASPVALNRRPSRARVITVNPSAARGGLCGATAHAPAPLAAVGSNSSADCVPRKRTLPVASVTIEPPPVVTRAEVGVHVPVTGS